MTYKTILVHADQSHRAAMRIKVAAEIAVAENAHLTGTAMSGLSRFAYQDNAYGVSANTTSMYIEALNASADLALTNFESTANSLGVLSHEKRKIDDDAEGGLVMQARYCDLAVVSQTDPEDRFSSLMSDLPAYVMLNCACPVLIVPSAGSFDHIGKNVLVAWDGSKEASRAITGALPILKRASKVTLAVFNASTQFGVHGELPGADIALFIARHGVNVEVSREVTEVDIGNSILSLAADISSDLLVMGGYGHTRFRELILGGATKTVLKTMTIPVLMAH